MIASLAVGCIICQQRFQCRARFWLDFLQAAESISNLTVSKGDKEVRGLTKFIGFLLLAGMLVFSSLATSSGSPEDHSKDSPAHPKRSISAEELFRRLSPSVFVVEGLNSEGAVTTTGSGVAVDIYTPSSPQAKFERELDHILGRWYVVTNAHVIQGAVRLRVRKGSRTWEDVRGIEYRTNPERDLCALRIRGSPPPAVTVRQSSTLRVGERVYALGAPEGLDLSLSEGIISGIRQTAQGPFIQTTAPMSPGSSGGGLFDAQGPAGGGHYVLSERGAES